MNKKEYNEWLKQYYKFKNNNLPTPYWNEDNNFEYVHVNKSNSKDDENDFHSTLEISSSLMYALGDVTGKFQLWRVK